MRLSPPRWLERGAGPPVVLLHGLMGHMHDWDPVLDILGGSSRAIAPELPIFDREPGDGSVESLARWVLHFLDVLGLTQVTLGGNSLGGQIALAAALAAPARVSNLVLTGSSGLPERSVVRGLPRRPSVAFVRQRMEEVFFDPALVTPESVEAVRRTLLAPALRLRVVRTVQAARRDAQGQRLREIAAPTLLVWGREDQITPISVAERFRAALPDATLVVLRHCGHAPMIERPEAFGAITRAWLEDARLVSALR